MKKFKQIIAATSLFTALVSPSLLAAELIVSVDNIKEIKGTLFISVYDKEKSFEDNENYLERKKITVDKNTLNINMGNYPAGEYAIKCFQDVNDNGEIDMSGGGIPSEPFGSSGKSTFFGPPSFNGAKFKLVKNEEIKIHLR